MREIIRPGIALFIITLIASISLGIVYEITAEPIQQQKLLTRDNSLKALMPNADGFTEDVVIGNPDIIGYFTCMAGSELIGHVISANSDGYSGTIEMLVAISTDGLIEGVSIVTQTETPGLGTNAQSPKFLDQYKNKAGAFTVTKSAAREDNEIEAIASSTITTKAVTKGVNNALDFWSANLKQGVN